MFSVGFVVVTHIVAGFLRRHIADTLEFSTFQTRKQGVKGIERSVYMEVKSPKNRRPLLVFIYSSRMGKQITVIPENQKVQGTVRAVIL